LVREVAFAIPGDLAAPTGGYAYDRRVMAELRDMGWTIRHVLLPGDFPAPSPASIEATGAAFAELPPKMPVLVDGLAFGALPEDLLAQAGRTFVALVHHPLGLETGLSPERSHELIARERAALVHASSVIVTSPATAALLAADFGVQPERITTALPGVEKGARSTGSGAGATPQLLAVGSLIPRKGYDVLVEALAEVSDLAWDCRIAGAMDRASDTAVDITRRIRSRGLEDRITLLGGLSDGRISAEYAAADIFVLASHFEGYGMVFAEALSHGLPIVACAGGATAQTVPADAGLLVEPGDWHGFSLALRRLLVDPKERYRRADAAWRHAAALPTWREAAVRIANVLEALL
jgi:glycosyltransferase involved in cell wall biosynthesis